MTYLSRFATWSQRHHWAALVAWTLVVGSLAVAAGQVSGAFNDDTTLPGSESQRVADALDRGSSADEITLVVHRDSGLTDSAARSAIGGFADRLAEAPGVSAVSDPFAAGSVAPNGQTALATVTLSDTGSVADLVDTRLAGFEVAWSGDAVEDADESDNPAEGIGLLAAVIILVPLFGSFLAAAMPLVTAVLAVGSAVSVVTLASHALTVPSYATSMMALVGLGVGIDYALLIFVRYRQEIREGTDRDTATARALNTAGRSVLFAGVTVIVALLGMLTLRLAAFDSLALSVALTVLATMLASITLLPALLTIFGRRLEKRIHRQEARRTRRVREPGERWRAFAGLIQRYPVPALIGGVLVLLALALPALSLRLGFADAGTDPPGSTTRTAYDLVADAFGPGTNGPLLVLAPDEATASNAAATVRTVPGVVSVVPRQAMLVVTPQWGPDDERTADLVHRLRASLGSGFAVGGSVPAAIDFADTVSARLPWFLGAVAGISALMLLVVFRSVLIPLQAAVSNLLSIGAALGVMTFVYGDGNLGVAPGPIEAFLPVIVFAVVFGLSMDYEVFLVSRVHEKRRGGADAATAVREGLATTGGVITAAAAIMIVVFGSFVLSGDRMLGQMGLGLAAAVLVDALVVRCLVVPAVFALLGERMWWLPRRWSPDSSASVLATERSSRSGGERARR